jgi:hypothetical protein
MVPVVRRVLVEARDDDVGLERADHPHDVRQSLVVPPDAERLLRGLRVAEVAHAREALLRPVDAARGEQLLGAHDVQELRLLAADEVLPAATARHRQVRGGRVSRVRQIGEQARVLVVRVGGDVEHAGGDAQPVDRVRERACVHRRLLGQGEGEEGGGDQASTSR